VSANSTSARPSRRSRTPSELKWLLNERAELADLTALESDLAKKDHRLTQLALKAPIAGAVNGLAALAPAQVVKA
jgi:hypothetical protein